VFRGLSVWLCASTKPSGSRRFASAFCQVVARVRNQWLTARKREREPRSEASGWMKEGIQSAQKLRSAGYSTSPLLGWIKSAIMSIHPRSMANWTIIVRTPTRLGTALTWLDSTWLAALLWWSDDERYCLLDTVYGSASWVAALAAAAACSVSANKPLHTLASPPLERHTPINVSVSKAMAFYLTTSKILVCLTSTMPFSDCISQRRLSLWLPRFLS